MNRNYTRIAIVLIVILTLISGSYLLAQQSTKAKIAPDYDAGIAAFKRGHYLTALYDFESRAHQGDKVAQFCLAYMLKNGMGLIEPKPNEALEWYEKSAKQGYAPAQNNLGVLYVRHAENVEDESAYMENIEIAEKWFKLAADQGNPPSQFNLSIIDFSKHSDWLIKAAVEYNYPPAQTQLFGLFSQLNDRDRNKISFMHSLKMLRMAAEKGYPYAQNNLATFYAYDEKAVQNHGEAFKWYTEASKQGIAEAYFNLGLYYEVGEVVDKNWDTAIEYYLLAAKQGLIDAQNNLGVLYLKKHKEEEAKEKKNEELSEYFLEMSTRWFMRAAQQDYPHAQLNIGKYFDLGVGNVVQDASEAFFWYKLALRNETNRKTLEDDENRHNSISNEENSKNRIAKLLDPGIKSKIENRIKFWKHKIPGNSGTGFYISKHYILTNAHVVLDTRGKPLHEFRIPYRNVELVKYWDRDVDLALLYDERGNTDTATFRISHVSSGENVSMFGYPQSPIYSYGGDIVPGIVSATSFEGNHPQFHNRFKHTAPTQPGNSGGPVFDSAGNVIGVCTNQGFALHFIDIKEPSISGNWIPQLINRAQNINFAIKSNVVEKFILNAKAKVNLDGLDFSVQTEFHFGFDSDGNIKVPSITLTEQRIKAKNFTVPVICYKNKEDLPLGVKEIHIEELDQ